MGTALFSLGKLLITPGAMKACAAFTMPPLTLFVRHATGDWSGMSADDQAANRAAITDGSRIFSAYQVGEERFFVITEADRRSTTILLANEY